MSEFHFIPHGNIEAAKNMLSGNPALLALRDTDGRTVLTQAVVDGDIAIVDFLIQAGADVNVADKALWTPLHFACQRNDLPLVEMLLDAGAGLNAQDSHGNTPLFRAVFSSKGFGDVIKALLQRGADPDIANSYGISARSAANGIANYNLKQFFE